MPEENPNEMPFQVGDVVEYAGNWGFEGEVIKISRRTVTVESATGETKKFDYKDLSPLE